MSILNWLIEKLPLKNYIIFESNPDFSDNTFWLFKYLAEETDLFQKFKSVWFIADLNKVRKELVGIPIICVDNNSRKIWHRLIRFYYTISSKVIIDCNRYIYKRKANQLRIYLTHGMPLKIPETYLKEIGDVDLISVSGTCFVDFFAKYVNRDCIKVYGLPRNDILYKSCVSQDNYILWMPTFRQHKNGVNNSIKNIFPLGIPLFKSLDDVIQIDELLEQNNIKLMLRPHPSQDLSVLSVEKQRHIIIADDKYLESVGESLYLFISHSSALITDYSSIYYDYLLLDRPIGLTFEDLDLYSRQWPMFFPDLKNRLPGEKLESIQDLKRFIMNICKGNDNTKEERTAFIHKCGLKKVNSCELIYNYIISNLS